MNLKTLLETISIRTPWAVRMEQLAEYLREMGE